MDKLDELESKSIYVIREAYAQFKKLALLWSIGKDMDGRVLTKIFRDEFRIDRQSAAIDTHDTSEFLARRGIKALPHPGEKERLEQLRSLGYIGDATEDR